MKIVHNIDTERETSRLAAVPVAKPSDDPGVMECPNALRAGTSRAPHIANFVALVVVTRGGHMKTFIVITGLVILIMILTPCSAAAAEQSAQRESMSQGGSEANATSYDSSRKHLESAGENLRRARAALYDDHAYDDQLDDMAVKLRQANDAIKGHAREARIKINQILMDADRIVGSLEKQETQAASLQGK